MRRNLFLTILVVLALQGHAPVAHAKTNWISDVLYVPLRSGPSTKHRIVHRGLKSGTPVELVRRDENSGFALVRTEGGTEGYIGLQYLSPEPIAAIKLERAEALISKMRQNQNPMQSQLEELEVANATLRQQNEQLGTEKAQLVEELEHIRAISADTVAIDQRNQELVQQNQALKNQITELHNENDRLNDASDREWFKLGAGAILLGVFLGIVLPFLKPRRKPQSGWV